MKSTWHLFHSFCSSHDHSGNRQVLPFISKTLKKPAPDEALQKQRKQNKSHCNICKSDYLCYIENTRFSLRFLDFCLFLPLHLSDLFNSVKGFVGTGRKWGNWRSSQQSLKIEVVCTLWSWSVRKTLFHLLRGSSTLNLQDKFSTALAYTGDMLQL